MLPSSIAAPSNSDSIDQNVHRNGILPEKLCNIIGLSGKEDFCRTKLCLCNVALAFRLIFAHYFRITFLSQTFTIFV